FDGVSVFTEAGQTMPDLVGNLKYAGTWGSAQISGALHQLRSDNLVVFPDGSTDFPDSELGWAITAQGSINLPMLAAGDALWLAATYA
ncbi:porin, partial [Microvirga sp. 3-52]|nr:porin [Microvirga sp. 3-52]